MENTGKVLFEDDSAVWYLALGKQVVGPVSPSEIYSRVSSQQITWLHYAWKKGQSNWVRLCDLAPFQSVIPAAPSAPPAPPAAAAVEPPSSIASRRVWFLYYNQTQYGPFADEEIRRFLETGKIHGRVHAWRDGMETWIRIESIPEFKGSIEVSKKMKLDELSKSSVKEMRENPRAPMVAKVMLAHANAVMVGMCRDISVGGMQVLTDQIPGTPGSKIKLNVTPTGQSEKQLDPFVADGVIVRILEDGCGFSFRFEKIDDAARKAIEKYISSSQD